ncbi:MAG: hypothetical protein LBR84_00200, partial [Tannerella sp.]|nr:hypothetical protein [Tannerella sp.]
MKRIVFVLVLGITTGVYARTNDARHCECSEAIAPIQSRGTVRGVITDAASGEALSGVTVIALGTEPLVGTTTDA